MKYLKCMLRRLACVAKQVVEAVCYRYSVKRYTNSRLGIGLLNSRLIDDRLAGLGAERVALELL
jgi:hypothetical protein